MKLSEFILFNSELTCIRLRFYMKFTVIHKQMINR